MRGAKRQKNVAISCFNAKIPVLLTSNSMTKVCQLTGKKKSTGYNISHSNRHTKRTFEPNVSKRTVIDPVTGTKLRLNVSTRALRTLVKNPGKFRTELASLVKKQTKKRAGKQ